LAVQSWVNLDLGAILPSNQIKKMLRVNWIPGSSPRKLKGGPRKLKGGPRKTKGHGPEKTWRVCKARTGKLKYHCFRINLKALTLKETDLYQPIKAYLESQNYEVKAEVCSCDVVAIRGKEPPVIVELKTGFTLPLLLQGVDRLAVSDRVYLAFAVSEVAAKNSLWRKSAKEIKKLCRRLGLGLISVHLNQTNDDFVEVHLDPQPYTPRKNKKRQGRLLREFELRVGDPNEGGVTRRSIITAYRQDALRCLQHLHKNGPTRLANLRTATGVARASGILQNDHYGWFERVDRGVYQVTPKGTAALDEFAKALAAM